jgi:glycosyltransferase involved in cell wall biosynthesis
MTTLLFDLTASQPNNSGKRHGGGKYCEMVFFRMCERSEKFQAFYDSSKYINPLILNAAKQNKIELYDICEQNLNDIVSTQNITHLYSALPESILPWPNCHILGTIHGLRMLEMPFDFKAHWYFDKGIIGLNSIIAFFNRKKLKKELLQYYSHLLTQPNFTFTTVSKHSLNVISEFFPKIGQKNIPVFYSPQTVQKKIREQKDNSILLVSANRFEKNCIRAIIAIDNLISSKKLSPRTQINITGLSSPDFRYKIKNPSQFRFWGYIEEDELNLLYAKSWLFIYPSLNEGFGYPPLEAMQYGTPVIASNRASIPEVCGNAAKYFNPTSIQEMKNAIIQLSNENTYKLFSNKSLQQYKTISEKQEKDLDLLIDWITNFIK